MNETTQTTFIERLAHQIVAKRRLVLIAAAALLIFCAVASFWVKVDDKLTSYLADDTETRQGVRIMEREFITYGAADVMIENVSPERAQPLSDTIAAIDGVAMVEYETADAGNIVKYSVTFSYPEDDDACKDALRRVKDALSGETISVSTDIGNSLSNTISGEMGGVIVIIAIVVLIVLLLTSETYAEVLVLVATFLAAALLHMGTNFLLGTISFISNAVAVVLQLALSLDYAVILCNRYKEEHQTYPIEEAVQRSLAVSIPEVFSSSLTTVAGLAAMTFMHFKLGADLGVVLIKAIMCSLISVFLLMPALLTMLGGWMDKTHHKVFVPKIPFVGRFAYQTRKIFPPIFVVLFIGAFLLSQKCYYAYSDVENLRPIHYSEQQLQKANIEEVFGKSNRLAVLVPAGDYEKEKQLAAELSARDEVRSVTALATLEATEGYHLADAVNWQEFQWLSGLDSTSAQAAFAYYGAAHQDQVSVAADLSNYRVPLIDLFLFLHDKAASGEVSVTQEQMDMIEGLYDKLCIAKDQLRGTEYSRMVLILNMPEEGDETFRFLDQIHVIAEQYYDTGKIFTAGNATNAYDFQKSFSRDNLLVTVLSILFVMVILLITFRSLGMPLLLILVIQGSICINFAISALLHGYVFFMVYLITTAIQMGANIDYAIVISSRFQELREEGMSPKDAIIETMNLSFPTIITSGTILAMAGLLIWVRVSYPVISCLGHYICIGTIISLLLVMFMLPQILLFGEKFVEVTRLRAQQLPRSFLRRGASLGLACAAIFALVAAPIGLHKIKNEKTEQREQTRLLTEQVDSLLALSDSMEARWTVYDDAAYRFAEYAVTDSVGSAQLAQGEASYSAGASQLAAAQAQYDAGLAQLESAKAEYAAGQEKLAQVQPIYDLVYPLYSIYLNTKAQYDAAVEAGNLILAAALFPTVEAQRIAYETQLGGYSISSLMAEYEAGQAQLQEGAAQITAGEAQLADAKRQLDAGYAELNSAGAQLNSGRATLAANRAALAEELNELNQYTDEVARLNAGVASLAQIPEIQAIIPTAATYGEVFSAAKAYVQQEDDATRQDYNLRTARSWVLLLAGLLALAAAALTLLASPWAKLAVLADLPLTVAALLLGGTAGMLQFIAALVLLLAIFAVGIISIRTK